MNHVFVDCENVHHIDLAVFGKKSVSFMVLVGASQTRLNIGLVGKLMERAAAVQVVRLTSSGKNALDFALAYYVGRAAVTDPTGYFHIVSRDTGYDPLIEHLRSRQIQARRHDDFSTLTLGFPGRAASAGSAAGIRPPQPKTAPPHPAKRAATAPKKAEPKPVSLVTRARDHLRKLGTKRPKRTKTLMSDLLSFLKPATASEVRVVVDTLMKDGHLACDEKDAVRYSTTL